MRYVYDPSRKFRNVNLNNPRSVEVLERNPKYPITVIRDLLVNELWMEIGHHQYPVKILEE